MKEINAHKDDVYYAIFSPDGHLLGTAGKDNRVCVWDASTGENKFESNIETGTVNAVTFSMDGHYLLAACRDRTARVWNFADGNVVAVLRGHDDQVNFAEFSPNNAVIITASDDHAVRIWEFSVGKTLLELRQSTSIKQAVFNTDGRLIVTVNDQGSVDLYSCELCGASGKELLTLAERSKTRDLTRGERARFLAPR